VNYVYILISLKDKRLYTGFTIDLKTRLRKHEKGLVRATKARLPIKLIYYEAYLDEKDVRLREKYLKGGKGKGELKIRLKKTYQKVEYKFRGTA